MAKEKQLTFWLLEPLDAHTNDVFRQYFPAESTAEDVGAVRREQGGELKFWRCRAYREAEHFEHSRHELRIRFKLHKRIGNGDLEECTFLLRRSKKLSAKSV